MDNLKKKMEKYPFVLTQLLDGYGDVPPIDLTARKEFSNKLSDFFLETPTREHWNEVLKYYDGYNKLSKKHKKFTKMGDDGVERTGDIFNKYFVKNFEVFRSNVDRLAKKNGIELVDFDRGIEDNEFDFGDKVVNEVGSTIKVCGKDIDKKDIKYPDVNDPEFAEKAKSVVIVRADSMKDSIKYGNGFCEVGHEWCTSKNVGSNLFYDYRFGKHGGIGEQTMYFVYFPDRYAKELETNAAVKPEDTTVEKTQDPNAVIHFGLNNKRQISYTDRTNEESTKSLSSLKLMFPALKKVNFSKVFTYVPLQNSERKIYKLPGILPVEEYQKMDNQTRLAWISIRAIRVDYNIWREMSKDEKNLWLIKSEGRNFDNLNVYIFRDIMDSSAGKRVVNKIRDPSSLLMHVRVEDRYDYLNKILNRFPKLILDQISNSLYILGSEVSQEKKRELYLKILKLKTGHSDKYDVKLNIQACVRGIIGGYSSNSMVPNYRSDPDLVKFAEEIYEMLKNNSNFNIAARLFLMSRVSVETAEKEINDIVNNFDKYGDEITDFGIHDMLRALPIEQHYDIIMRMIKGKLIKDYDHKMAYNLLSSDGLNIDDRKVQVACAIISSVNMETAYNAIFNILPNFLGEEQNLMKFLNYIPDNLNPQFVYSSVVRVCVATYCREFKNGQFEYAKKFLEMDTPNIDLFNKIFNCVTATHEMTWTEKYKVAEYIFEVDWKTIFSSSRTETLEQILVYLEIQTFKLFIERYMDEFKFNIDNEFIRYILNVLTPYGKKRFTDISEVHQMDLAKKIIYYLNDKITHDTVFVLLRLFSHPNHRSEIIRYVMTILKDKLKDGTWENGMGIKKMESLIDTFLNFSGNPVSTDIITVNLKNDLHKLAGVMNERHNIYMEYFKQL